MLEVFAQLKPAYFTDESVFEVIWRTLLTNQIVEEIVPEPDVCEIFLDMLLGYIAFAFVSSDLRTEENTQYMMHLLSQVPKSPPGHVSLPSPSEALRFWDMLSASNLDLDWRPEESLLQPLDLARIARSEENNMKWNRINIFSGYRRLFLTSQGYPGLGPMSAEVGDEVCLLLGSRVPFVLRPTPNDTTFSLIGDCYVHGAMHGEMLDGDLKERLNTIHIV